MVSWNLKEETSFTEDSREKEKNTHIDYGTN